MSDKVKAIMKSSSSQKTTIAPAAKHTVEEKKESLRAGCEQKVTNDGKPKLIVKTRLEHKVNKEVLAEKDD